MFSCSFILFCLISLIKLFHPILTLTFSYCIMFMSPAQLLYLVIILLSSYCILYYLSCIFIVSYLSVSFTKSCLISLHHLLQPVSSLPIILSCFVSPVHFAHCIIFPADLLYPVLPLKFNYSFLSSLSCPFIAFYPLFFSFSLSCLLSFIFVFCLNSSSHLFSSFLISPLQLLHLISSV